MGRVGAYVTCWAVDIVSIYMMLHERTGNMVHDTVEEDVKKDVVEDKTSEGVGDAHDDGKAKESHDDKAVESAVPTENNAPVPSDDKEALLKKLASEMEKSSVLRSVLIIVTAFVIVAVQIPIEYLVVKVLLLIALVYVGVFSFKFDTRDYKHVKGKKWLYWLSLAANVFVALAFTFLMVRVSWTVNHDIDLMRTALYGLMGR